MCARRAGSGATISTASRSLRCRSIRAPGSRTWTSWCGTCVSPQIWSDCRPPGSSRATRSACAAPPPSSSLRSGSPRSSARWGRNPRAHRRNQHLRGRRDSGAYSTIAVVTCRPGPKRPAPHRRIEHLMPLLVLAAAMLLVTMGASPGAAAPPRMGATGLQEEVDELLAEHVGVTTPGAMVAVVGPEGPLVLEAEGWADPLARSRLTLDSRTPVASVTKVVTSLTALRLHHEGLLDLDADIRGDLPLTDRREDAARTPVTSRHLLTHHSGLSEPLLVHPQAPDSQLATLRDVLEQNPPVLDHPATIGLHYPPLPAHALLDPLTGRAGSDRVATPWPNVPQRPAATLTWSTHDAAALLDALITPDSPLPAPVVEEATTTTVRPAHGGGGHPQVFFEGRRAEVPVLEHAGANGLAWLALVPEAEIGVFAAVTTEDSEAAAFTESVLETVADWRARSGLADRTPVREHGAPTITPPWALPHEPADPTGTYQQRLFAGQGPELLLRTATGQVTITR